jgi:hypothetical protein
VDPPVEPELAAEPEPPREPEPVLEVTPVREPDRIAEPGSAVGTARSPRVPLLPSDAPPPESIEDLERITTRERLGLLLAVLVPPAGLVLAIGNALRSTARRGWVPGLVRLSVAVGAVLSIAVGIGAAALWNRGLDAIHRDELRAASAAFCSTVAQRPELLTPPDYGWPAPAASIPESIAAMQGFAASWAAVAAASPPELRDGISGIVAAATRRVVAVSIARTVDDPGNRAVVGSAVVASGVMAWNASYCG